MTNFPSSEVYWGTIPSSPLTQSFPFNFSDFEPDSDPHFPDSIALLKAQGVDFAKNKEKGINSCKFASLLVSYRLVLNWSRVTWLCFHGSYDSAYLIKILRGGDPLPETLCEFITVVAHLFGIRFYDVKQILKFCPGMHGGLERVAQSLQINRLAGKSHQAGSDSLLTLHIFRMMTQRFLPRFIFASALKTAVGSEAAQARQFLLYCFGCKSFNGADT
ncbi:hypothetical protein RJ641_003782 [Dillenia turbinata]|uniref:Uncharacterized protein n=1 Tax=Dillenia turbinata TaxID=194707 RepID=A0AAN8ZDH2_9MAGN